MGSYERMHKLLRIGRERIKIFAIDDTEVKVAGEDAWQFIPNEPFANRILGLHFSWNTSSMQVEMLLNDLIRKYRRHPV